MSPLFSQKREPSGREKVEVQNSKLEPTSTTDQKPETRSSKTETPKQEAKEKEKKKKGLERVYIIPLRKAFDYTRTKRARRAIDLIRAFAQRHMKCQAVKFDTKVNELVWAHGIQKIPRKVKVRLEKVDELTTIFLA